MRGNNRLNVLVNKSIVAEFVTDNIHEKREPIQVQSSTVISPLYYYWPNSDDDECSYSFDSFGN